jgi:hypothetical protein
VEGKGYGRREENRRQKAESRSRRQEAGAGSRRLKADRTEKGHYE